MLDNKAQRIETARLIIRKYEIVDALLLKKSIDESIKHLRPWMPWAEQEPEPLEKKIERLTDFKSKFEANEDYAYGIFDKEETKLIGGTGLHTRQGPKILEIGYWTNIHEINKGYITESSYALTKIAFEHIGIDKVEIRCDEKNLASARIPEKLGFKLEYKYRQHEFDAKGNRVVSKVYVLFKEEFKIIEKYDAIKFGLMS